LFQQFIYIDVYISHFCSMQDPLNVIPTTEEEGDINPQSINDSTPSQTQVTVAFNEEVFNREAWNANADVLRTMGDDFSETVNDKDIADAGASGTQAAAFDAADWSTISVVIRDVDQVNPAQHQTTPELFPKEDPPLVEQQQNVAQQVSGCLCQAFLYISQALFY
jgi:hypothetical protein